MDVNNNAGQMDNLIADLDQPVGLCVDGGNIGGVKCAVIKGAVKIITELLK